MKINDVIIEFKSNTPNYYKEESGKKQNTIRKLLLCDIRYKMIKIMLDTDVYGKIKIIHKQLPKECFIRQITDITPFGGYFLISWIHKKVR